MKTAKTDNGTCHSNLNQTASQLLEQIYRVKEYDEKAQTLSEIAAIFEGYAKHTINEKINLQVRAGALEKVWKFDADGRRVNAYRPTKKASRV
jgi:hypothetical protein